MKGTIKKDQQSLDTEIERSQAAVDDYYNRIVYPNSNSDLMARDGNARVKPATPTDPSLQRRIEPQEA